MTVLMPAHLYVTAGLQRRVNRVAHHIDQELLQLIRIRLKRHRVAGLHLDRLAHLEARDPFHQRREIDVLQVGTRKSCKGSVGRGEPTQASVRAAIMLNPRRMSSRQSSGSGS